MAVSFKVPASPKRDIFNMDNFLGVDLTNTGSNIEETRSPNAENMVRFVPGKVRKRTGYHTQVKFGDGKDVNRALNTSDKWVEIPNVGDIWARRTIFAKFNEPIHDPYGYVELNGKGTYVVGRTYVNGGGSIWGTITIDHQSEEEWVTLSSFNSIDDRYSEELYIYKTSSDPDDYINVRNIRISSSTVATTSTEWKAMPWTPAPEDNGIIYVNDTEDPTIYGCHRLKAGSFVGNRVTNVNRALGTHSTFDSFTIDDTQYSILYNVGNLIYRTLDSGETTPIIVEFDYISDGEATLAWGGYSAGANKIENTNGEVYHYKDNTLRGSFIDLSIRAKADSGTVNLQIRNMSILYDKDDNYHWTPAPEDNQGEFAIADIYNVDSKNYSITDAYSGSVTTSSLSGYVALFVADADSHINGFVKVSFDLYTSTETELDRIEIKCEQNGGNVVYAGQVTLNENANHKHIEIYTSSKDANHYIDGIYAWFYLKSTDGKVSASFTNVEVREIVGKKNFDISNKYYVYHAGSKFFLRASNSTKVSEIYSNANQHISQSWQLNDKLIIIDGKNTYTYSVGDEKVNILGIDEGYIPTVTVSKNPEGGGQSLDPLNMLQPGFYELFIVDSTHTSETNFHLSFSGLDSTEVKAWVLDSNSNWARKKEGTDFTVDRVNGIIKFTIPPGLTPISGEDNVKILAYRTVPGYLDRVAKCTTGTLFGVGGAADRLFLSGNAEYPNWDFYSEMYDPTYFPDTGYSSLGSAASAIVGYAIVNNYLATFKDDFDSSQAVFIREGDLVVDSEKGTSEPAFRLINTLQGNGVVAPYSFGYLQTEPLFLTKSGIYAITAQDITGEKYSQNRSFYLNGALTKESNLQNAVATVFNDQYVLAVNGKFYILDGLQATRTDRSEPYATRQYVGFYCTNIPAVSIWTDDQALWIGTNDGRVCRFATDIEALDSYNDDGVPVYGCWETPDLDGKLFYKNKTFRYFAIRMMKSLRTTVLLSAAKLGNWTAIKEDSLSGVVFDFNTIDFENFSFSTDRSEKVVHTKVRVKKVDKARFKIESGYITEEGERVGRNEPFGLFDLALEYIERGNYKG